MDATPDPRSRWSAWRALAGDLKRPGLVALGVLLILIALIGAFGGWAPAAQGLLPVVGAGETVNLGPWDVTFEKAMLADEVEPWGYRDPSQRYYLVAMRVVSVVDEPVSQAAFEDVFTPLYDGLTIEGSLGTQKVVPEAGRVDLRRMIGAFQPRLGYDVWVICARTRPSPTCGNWRST